MERFLHAVYGFESPAVEVELDTACAEVMGGCEGLGAPLDCEPTMNGCFCTRTTTAIASGWTSSGPVLLGQSSLEFRDPPVDFGVLPMRFCRSAEALVLRPFWKASDEPVSGDGLVFSLRRVP